MCEAFLQLDIRNELPAIECPALVVGAERDILKPVRYSEELASAIPNARLEVIAGAGHAVVIEQPKTINAFIRRLQFIVEFPFPDEEYRRRIWENVFSKETPLGSDVRFDRLAKDVRLAGGNIKNMAVAAAFYAAAAGDSVHMDHLIQAAHREHQKLGRSWSRSSEIGAAKATTQ